MDASPNKIINPKWQSFLKNKQDGNMRNNKMSNFIQKANVFQNDSTLQSDRNK